MVKTNLLSKTNMKYKETIQNPWDAYREERNKTKREAFQAATELANLEKGYYEWNRSGQDGVARRVQRV